MLRELFLFQQADDAVDIEKTDRPIEAEVNVIEKEDDCSCPEGLYNDQILHSQVNVSIFLLSQNRIYDFHTFGHKMAAEHHTKLHFI